MVEAIIIHHSILLKTLQRFQNQKVLILKAVNFDFCLNFCIVSQNANVSIIDERYDVYELVGIICDNLFQEDTNDNKSVMLYYDGNHWINNGEKYVYLLFNSSHNL